MSEEELTEEEIAKALGYKVIAASPFEVGLVKNGRGVRTWWSQDFNCKATGKLPGLDHPIIQETIARHEAFLAE